MPLQGSQSTALPTEWGTPKGQVREEPCDGHLSCGAGSCRGERPPSPSHSRPRPSTPEGQTVFLDFIPCGSCCGISSSWIWSDSQRDSLASKAVWMARSSDPFLRICQYQNWQIPVSAQPGPWGGWVEEGQLPVPPQLLLGKNPLPPLPLVGLPLPGRVGIITRPAQCRRPPRPRATLTSLHRVRAEREATIAVPVSSPAPAHFFLLS